MALIAQFGRKITEITMLDAADSVSAFASTCRGEEGKRQAATGHQVRIDFMKLFQSSCFKAAVSKQRFGQERPNHAAGF